MKKQWIAVFLALVLSLSLAAPAYAADLGSLAPGLYISAKVDPGRDKEVYEGYWVEPDYCAWDKDASGDGWSYSAASKTLTLRNFKGMTVTNEEGFEYHNYCGGVLLVNGGSVTVALEDGTVNQLASLQAVNTNVTIKGNGKLMGYDLHVGGISYAEDVKGTSSNDLTIESGILNVITYYVTGKVVQKGTATDASGNVLTLGLAGLSKEDEKFLEEIIKIDLDIAKFQMGHEGVWRDSAGETWTPPSYEAEDMNLWETTDNVTVKASGTTPSTDKKALAKDQTIQIDGKATKFQTYALKDASGGLTNYVKLRDLASLLNGSKAQFEVGYDNSSKVITITTGKAYTPNGSELSTPFSGDRPYKDNAKPIQINGAAADLDAIVLTDDNGGGYTYFKLRDLGEALGFNVSWSAERGVYLETDKPYSNAD